LGKEASSQFLLPLAEKKGEQKVKRKYMKKQIKGGVTMAGGQFQQIPHENTFR